MTLARHPRAWHPHHMLGSISKTGRLRRAKRRTKLGELLILCARIDYTP